MGTLVCKTNLAISASAKIGKSGLKNLVWDLWFGAVGLGCLVWDLWFGALTSRLWRLGNFGLGSLVWNANLAIAKVWGTLA